MTDETTTDTTDTKPAEDLGLDHDEPQEVADDLDDLDADDYAAAAGQLAQEAAQGQDGTTEGDDEAEPEATGRGPRYRERLRDAEAERDRLSGVVEGMRRNEIQRLAAAKLADPSDLFRDGATVADVLDDDGQVDAAKLGGLVDELLAAHPHWRAEVPRYKGPLYSGATNMRLVDVPPTGFADAFGPKSGE